MTWIVEWDDQARKELRKLDKQLKKNILKYLRERIAINADPHRFGKPLSYDKHGYGAIVYKMHVLFVELKTRSFSF